jgi:inorganic pyrophosphatase
MRIKQICMLLVGVFLAGFSSMAVAQDPVSSSVTVVDEYTLKGEKDFYKDYPAGDSDGYIHAVIEIPKGTTGKWEVNTKDSTTIVWEFKKGKPRVVDYKGGYSANYGSIPQTAMPQDFGGDGENVDIVVLGEAIPRGEVVKVKVVGLLNMVEPDGFDPKILAVKAGSLEAEEPSIDALNAKYNNIVDETASWFENYKGPDAGIKVESIGSADEAMTILLAAIEASK